MIPLGLYVHFPWCQKKCPYCDFNSHLIPAKQQLSRYIESLLLDLKQQNNSVFDTVFLGGGTPSLFSGKLLAKLFCKFNIKNHAEITIEANPNSLTFENLLQYRQIGINRLSLGAQSFSNRHLKLIARLHNKQQIIDGVHKARKAGFENINLDIMFALPGQTQDDALADLNCAIKLKPEHISWYQLTIEPNTVFATRTPKNLPNDDEVFDTQTKGIELLKLHGFKRYEISAFSRDMPCQHNLNYWQFGDYLGIGAGAHGKLTQNGQIIRSVKHYNPDEYMQANNKTVETTKAQDVVFEFMLNALRLTEGFNIKLFEQRTGFDYKKISTTINHAIELGFLQKINNNIKPTNKGINFHNDLVAMFLP